MEATKARIDSTDTQSVRLETAVLPLEILGKSNSVSYSPPSPPSPLRPGGWPGGWAGGSVSRLRSSRRGPHHIVAPISMIDVGVVRCALGAM